MRASSAYIWFLLIVVALLAATLAPANAQCRTTVSTVLSTQNCVVCPAQYLVRTMPGAPNVNVSLLVAPGGSNGTYLPESGLLRADVLLLYDTTGSTSNDRSLLKNEINGFIGNLSLSNGYSDTRVGVSSCRSGSSYSVYTRHASLTQNAQTLENAIEAIVVNSNEQNTPVWGPDCISRAMLDGNVGWRTQAFRVVIFLSGNPIFTSYNLSSDIYSTNIVPLFYIPTASAATIANIRAYAASLPVAFINFGSLNDNSKPYQGWSLDVSRSLNDTTISVFFQRNSPSPVHDAFIRSLPENASLPYRETFNMSVAVGYPPGHNVTLHPTLTAQVSVLGFGTQQYHITVVQPPTAFAGSYSGLQGAGVSFTVSGIAPSGQALNLVIVSSPHGEVYDRDGTVGPYVLNTEYAGQTHTFRPNPFFWNSTYVTVRISDGCQLSSPVNVTFAITRSNTAPRANNFTVTIPYNSRVLSEQRINFTDNVSDDTDPIFDLRINITWVETSDLGQLVVGSTAFPISGHFSFYPSQTLRFIPTQDKAGTTKFQFRVSDTAGLSSTIATVTVIVQSPTRPGPSQPGCVSPVTCSTCNCGDLDCVPVPADSNISCVPGRLEYTVGFAWLNRTEVIVVYPSVRVLLIGNVTVVSAILKFEISNSTLRSPGVIVAEDCASIKGNVLLTIAGDSTLTPVVLVEIIRPECFSEELNVSVVSAASDCRIVKATKNRVLNERSQQSLVVVFDVDSSQCAAADTLGSGTPVGLIAGLLATVVVIIVAIVVGVLLYRRAQMRRQEQSELEHMYKGERN